MEQRFTSNEVAALTGMTPRQLQWWDERGIVVPEREGRRRLYSFDDLAEVAVIGELRVRGFSLQRLRKVMRFLQREFGKRLVETVSAGSDYHLLTDGHKIYLETSPQQALDILKNARQPMFAICLSDTVRRVHAGVFGQDIAPPPAPGSPGHGTAGMPNPAPKHQLAPPRRGSRVRRSPMASAQAAVRRPGSAIA